MRLHAISALACGVVLVLGTSLAAADPVYKWTDSEGHVHFSQTPPPNATTGVKQMNVNPAPPDPQSLQNQQALVQAQQDQAQKAKDAKDAADKNKPDPQVQALKKQQCEDLRSRLAILQRGGRAATTDAQGNMTFLDDAERAKQEAAIQDQISKTCGGG